MIEPGDKIAIGISGGKDSLTLLYALQGLRRFYPIPFELCAVTVDLGFGSSSTSYPTKCTPYIAKPSMCRLKMDEAQTVFSYSLQQMR